MAKEVKKAAGISTEAVLARTGKGWLEWFAILDAAGAMRMGHKEIVAHLSEHHGVPGWWQQMITVAYEQERGLRQKHETTTGYQASASMTVATPVAKLYMAWQDETIRHRWLPNASLAVRKATQNKSLRITWSQDKTDVDVNFYARGEARSQVSLSHTKLASSKDVERMKAYWAEALGRLKGMLET